MSQVRIEITNPKDRKSFDTALAQTVAYIEAHTAEAECMIAVRTVSGFNNLTKIVSCPLPDALSFFIRSYDGGAVRA